jgi:hypothetical protein
MGKQFCQYFYSEKYFKWQNWIKPLTYLMTYSYFKIYFNMNTNKIVLAIIICSTFFGCASNMMIIDNKVKEDISPIGIFVCASTQIIDNMDTLNRAFVINKAFATFEELFGDKYKIVNLNNQIPYSAAFKKYFGSFYINDKAIGKYAVVNNCKTYLIVYYAETDMNFTFILSPFGMHGNSYIISFTERPFSTDDGYTLHSSCSLYGWLYKTETKKKIKRSHAVLESFDDFISQANLDKPTTDNYSFFLSQITKKMFISLK